MIGKLCCGSCGKVLKADDVVKLGEFNTVNHIDCESAMKERTKDARTLEEIIAKYDFMR